ncbi:MAG: hypothetical protein KAX49_18570 [Halanaerobiales bacterium]|nr:hypothetical protein [Halanaerobiales bacterium]
MKNEIIVFISEGEKTEKQILDNLKTNFFSRSDNKELIFLSFNTHIYQLYKKLKEDDFQTEVIEILIERDPSVENEFSNGRDKQSISQIFLFFDYDGHAVNGQDGDEIIKEMIEFFDNETEQGKLYVSYPMVEAIRDLKTKDSCWRRCSVPAKINIKYKNVVTDCTEFCDLTNLRKDDWFLILRHSLKKANCIVMSSFNIPIYREYRSHINQVLIFSNQLDKFININDRVAVLGGFPFFLIDYFGENIYKQITDNSKC